jgi:hypothetical protein
MICGLAANSGKAIWLCFLFIENEENVLNGVLQIICKKVYRR